MNNRMEKLVLSDSKKMKGAKSGAKKKIVPGNKAYWSDSQKIEAVTTYLALGSVRLTANVLKIPETTILHWRMKDWWKDVEHELRLQENLQLSSRLKRIIGATLDVAEDRLQNGDFIYDNRKGELVRKPVSLRDANKVMIDLSNRKDVLDGQAPKQVNIEQIDDRLKKLAEKFEQIANGNNRTVQVTDVIIGEEVVESDSTSQAG